MTPSGSCRKTATCRSATNSRRPQNPSKSSAGKFNGRGQNENFQKASDSIKSTIKKYVKQYCLDYDNVNLIITGHSRGAAVANLYAKEATDSINGVYNDSIPSFSSVTAYTFATPNVAIYDDSMENYNNIYNFCFEEDIVPTVPLTKPVTGWGYWKYGKTFFGKSKRY